MEKDHLSVSLEIFKNCLANFQTVAKRARAEYFSEIISKLSYRPKILFSTINSVLSPGRSHDVEASTDICEKFLKFFT